MREFMNILNSSPEPSPIVETDCRSTFSVLLEGQVMEGSVRMRVSKILTAMVAAAILSSATTARADDTAYRPSTLDGSAPVTSTEPVKRPTLNFTGPSPDMGLLREVNRRINHSIKPMEDIDQYGKDDVWVVYPKAGDCEDIALTKRAELIKLGVAANRLFIQIVTHTDGTPGTHAVLLVKTDKGWMVLDNLTDQVKDFRSTTYKPYAIMVIDR
jgi:predicted transglutaminase-like cysteine proteinase